MRPFFPTRTTERIFMTFRIRSFTDIFRRFPIFKLHHNSNNKKSTTTTTDFCTKTCIFLCSCLKLNLSNLNINRNKCSLKTRVKRDTHFVVLLFYKSQRKFHICYALRKIRKSNCVRLVMQRRHFRPWLFAHDVTLPGFWQLQGP